MDSLVRSMQVDMYAGLIDCENREGVGMFCRDTSHFGESYDLLLLKSNSNV
jgi:hypothetical protein